MSKSDPDAGGAQPPRMEARAAAATKQGGRRPRVKPTDALLGALRSPETVNRGKDTKETVATIWSGDWCLEVEKEVRWPSSPTLNDTKTNLFEYTILITTVFLSSFSRPFLFASAI